MFPSRRANRTAIVAALAGLVMASATQLQLCAQQTAPAAVENFALPPTEPSTIALPLPEDRGQADLEQMLRRLRTTASVLYIVAHPDDEDGALLTFKQALRNFLAGFADSDIFDTGRHRNALKFGSGLDYRGQRLGQL